MVIRAAFECSITPQRLTTPAEYVMHSSVILPIRQDEQTGWEKENLLGALPLHSSQHGRPGHGRPTQAPGTPQDRFPFEPCGPICVSERSCATNDLVSCQTYEYGQTVVRPKVETGTIPLVSDPIRRR
jgi:hypothetical protein